MLTAGLSVMSIGERSMFEKVIDKLLEELDSEMLSRYHAKELIIKAFGCGLDMGWASAYDTKLHKEIYKYRAEKTW